MNELTIGTATVSVILSILLRMIYNTVPLGNRWKPWIAVSLGMMLAGVSMGYSVDVITKRIIIDYMAGGFMVGATAIGFYEMTQKGSSG